MPAMSTATADAAGPATAPEPPAPSRGPAWLEPLRNAPRLVRGLAFATIVGNAVVVLTGVAVRLSGSGLGCPTWPKCTADSYTNTPEYGIHGYIEFGNRLLTFALSAIVGAAIIAVVLQRARRRSLVWLSLAQFGGIVAQAVVGGITVLTGLNPWTVSAHFLVSMVLIYAGYVFWHRAGEGDGPREWRVSAPLRWLARAITAAAGLTIVIGTVVTGSGPHSGDGAAPRTGFDPALISQLHADAVFLLVGLTIGGILALRTHPVPRRAVTVLLLVELAQGLIGYVQYFTHLPVLLVALHVLGSAVLWVFAVRVLFTIRERPVTA